MVIQQMQKKAITVQSAYNQMSGNGLCTTLAALVATRLGYTDIHHLTALQKRRIQQGHLLLVLFNAMQPGIFSISAWDLVGTLPLEPEQIAPLLKDKDWRWLNRGSYDLLGDSDVMNASTFGIPQADAIYGPIPKQLNDPHSFVSQVKKILAVREHYDISGSKEIAIPKVKNDGAVILINKLPHRLGFEITALNFGDNDINETIDIQTFLPSSYHQLKSKKVINLFMNETDSSLTDDDILRIHLPSLSGKILLLK